MVQTPVGLYQRVCVPTATDNKQEVMATINGASEKSFQTTKPQPEEGQKPNPVGLNLEVYSDIRQCLVMHVERRYNWLRKRLKAREEVWAIFPEAWRVPQLLCLMFCQVSHANNISSQTALVGCQRLYLHLVSSNWLLGSMTYLCSMFFTWAIASLPLIHMCMQ